MLPMGFPIGIGTSYEMPNALEALVGVADVGGRLVGAKEGVLLGNQAVGWPSLSVVHYLLIVNWSWDYAPGQFLK